MGEETLWLTQQQMADLDMITTHLFHCFIVSFGILRLFLGKKGGEKLYYINKYNKDYIYFIIYIIFLTYAANPRLKIGF